MKYLRRTEPWTEEIKLGTSDEVFRPIATFTSPQGHFVRHVVRSGKGFMVVSRHRHPAYPRRYSPEAVWRVQEILAVTFYPGDREQREDRHG